MGYVAVCTDEEEIKRLGRRDILIAWRGTIMNSEWAANMETNMVPAAMDPRPGNKLGTGGLGVEKGFLSLYITKKPNTRYNQTSARQQVTHTTLAFPPSLPLCNAVLDTKLLQHQRE